MGGEGRTLARLQVDSELCYVWCNSPSVFVYELESDDADEWSPIREIPDSNSWGVEAAHKNLLELTVGTSLVTCRDCRYPAYLSPDAGPVASTNCHETSPRATGLRLIKSG